MDEKEPVTAQNLVFPDAPEFMAEPVQFSATEMAEMCERMLPIWNKQRYAKPDQKFVGEPFTLDLADKEQR
jgi:hypothetical protein